MWKRKNVPDGRGRRIQVEKNRHKKGDNCFGCPVATNGEKWLAVPGGWRAYDRGKENNFQGEMDKDNKRERKREREREREREKERERKTDPSGSWNQVKIRCKSKEQKKNLNRRTFGRVVFSLSCT